MDKNNEPSDKFKEYLREQREKYSIPPDGYVYVPKTVEEAERAADWRKAWEVFVSKLPSPLPETEKPEGYYDETE